MESLEYFSGDIGGSRVTHTSGDINNTDDPSNAESESECIEEGLSTGSQGEIATGGGISTLQQSARRSGLQDQGQIAANETDQSPVQSSEYSPHRRSAHQRGECDESSSPDFSDLPRLKWRDIPYPGVPQVGYAFSYASGPINFVKVSSKTVKCLEMFWQTAQNYVAFVLYSLHPSPSKDQKLLGLEMVNELAAHGFIENEDCCVVEEKVQDMRALSFHFRNVLVSIPNLGDKNSFRSYWQGSRVVEEDRNMISDRLQRVMHDRALLAQTAISIASPCSATSSDELGSQKATVMALETEEQLTLERSQEALTELEDCGLVKFVKVDWRVSKWIDDNIHAIRYVPSPGFQNSRGAAEVKGKAKKKQPTVMTTTTTKDFKGVIVWSNKTDRKEGINFLERMIAARLVASRQECKDLDYLKDVEVYHEVVDYREQWLVFRKKSVVVGFPGRDGDEEFLDTLQAMGPVWR